MDNLPGNMHFLCFHVENLHESTKTCSHVFSPFSAVHYIVMVKGGLYIYFRTSLSLDRRYNT